MHAWVTVVKSVISTGYRLFVGNKLMSAVADFCGYAAVMSDSGDIFGQCPTCRDPEGGWGLGTDLLSLWRGCMRGGEAGLQKQPWQGHSTVGGLRLLGLVALTSKFRSKMKEEWDRRSAGHSCAEALSVSYLSAFLLPWFSALSVLQLPDALENTSNFSVCSRNHEPWFPISICLFDAVPDCVCTTVEKEVRGWSLMWKQLLRPETRLQKRFERKTQLIPLRILSAWEVLWKW